MPAFPKENVFMYHNNLIYSRGHHGGSLEKKEKQIGVIGKGLLTRCFFWSFGMLEKLELAPIQQSAKQCQ